MMNTEKPFEADLANKQALPKLTSVPKTSSKSLSKEPSMRAAPNGATPKWRPAEINVGKFRLMKTLGKGNFAKVKLAKHIPTGEEVAIKIIDKTQLNPSALQKLTREVRYMKMLNHPNIVKLIQVIETEKTTYLIMEYASKGELFDYLVLNGRMKEKEAREKFRQIVSAVQYCHQKGIVHRDLKAENLLLDADLNIKIADFGFSNEFTTGSKLDTYCGSPPYAAPELFRGLKYDGPEVDVWSLGVLLYTMVSGTLPFDGATLRELRERVLRGKYRVPFYMSIDCENLLRKFLVVNPAKRANLENVMKEKWLNMSLEELRPHIEPQTEANDQKRMDVLVAMGYPAQGVLDSLDQGKYDEAHATYILLGRKLSNCKDGEKSSQMLSSLIENVTFTSSAVHKSPSHKSNSSSICSSTRSETATFKSPVRSPSYKSTTSTSIPPSKAVEMKSISESKTSPALRQASNAPAERPVTMKINSAASEQQFTGDFKRCDTFSSAKVKEQTSRLHPHYQRSTSTSQSKAASERESFPNKQQVPESFARNSAIRSTFHSGQPKDAAVEEPPRLGKTLFQRLQTRFSKRIKSNKK